MIPTIQKVEERNVIKLNGVADKEAHIWVEPKKKDD